METIVLGGGCFWCTEAVFKMIRGVRSVTPGYAGGEVENPTYEQVCNGSTGHAEVVKIEYDPKELKFDELMEIFFASHDPTTMNRQGNDYGEQYRSVILYTNDGQRKDVEKFIKRIQPEYGNKIVTQVLPLKGFYPAESYHMDYYERNPEKAYCSMVISPKIAKIRKEFAGELKGGV